MDPITIPPDRQYIFQLQGNVPGVFPGTMTISSTVNAFVTKIGVGTYQISTRTEAIPAPGAHVPVSLTINAVDAYGATVPPQVFPFILDGPPPPPGVSEITLINGSDQPKFNYPSPPDPGSATIDL